MTDELIRKSDALAQVDYTSNSDDMCYAPFLRDRIRELPAVTMGVKPIGADGVKIHPQDILNAAWRDDLGEEGLAMYDRILAALTPIPVDDSQPADPAAIREAALVDAAEGLSAILDKHETKGPLPDIAMMLCWLAAQNVRAALRAIGEGPMGERCRWVYDNDVPGGKFLVPGCMNRANGGEDYDCHCPEDPETVEDRIEAMRHELAVVRAELAALRTGEPRNG